MSITVTLVDHPLVADSLARIRDRDTPNALFRSNLERIGTLLLAEATANLPTVDGTVETPLTTAPAKRLAIQPVVVPVLRAGLGFVHAAQELMPNADVGFIGISRDEATFEPKPYVNKLPETLAGRPGHRDRSDAGNRWFAGQDRSAPARTPALRRRSSWCVRWPLRRASSDFATRDSSSTSSPRRSTITSTSTRSSCRGWVTQATANSAAESDGPARSSRADRQVLGDRRRAHRGDRCAHVGRLEDRSTRPLLGRRFHALSAPGRQPVRSARRRARHRGQPLHARPLVPCRLLAAAVPVGLASDPVDPRGRVRSRSRHADDRQPALVRRVPGCVVPPRRSTSSATGARAVRHGRRRHDPDLRRDGPHSSTANSRSWPPHSSRSWCSIERAGAGSNRGSWASRSASSPLFAFSIRREGIALAFAHRARAVDRRRLRRPPTSFDSPGGPGPRRSVHRFRRSCCSCSCRARCSPATRATPLSTWCVFGDATHGYIAQMFGSDAAVLGWLIIVGGALGWILAVGSTGASTRRPRSTSSPSRPSVEASSSRRPATSPRRCRCSCSGSSLFRSASARGSVIRRCSTELQQRR